MHAAGGGGEAFDVQMERVDYLRASAITVGTTAARIVSGSRHLTLPLATNAANCTVPCPITTGAATGVLLFQCQVGVSGTPSSEIGLLSAYANPTTERYVRIGTDRKIRVYDSAGTQVGHTSRNVISDTGMTHFAICYDFLFGQPNLAATSGASNRAYVTLWVNNQWEWDGLIAAPSGTPLITTTGTDIVWGEDLDAAVNRGVDAYIDDYDADRMAASGSYESKFLPHIAAYPVMQVVGGNNNPPTANGTHVAWTGGAGDYTGLDDGATNDGDTTFVGDGTSAGVKETYTYSAANPTDSADTIHDVSMRAVKRNTGAAKNTPFALLRDASANESTGTWASASTSYLGEIVFGLSRPAGGAWGHTDFDLTAGVSNLEFGMQAAASSAAARITSLPGPEITKYEARNMGGRMWN